MRIAVAVTVAALSLVACDNADSRPDRTSVQPATGETERGGAAVESPPSVIVHAGSAELKLKPWTYCWANGCADGAPPESPPDAGSPDELIVEFPESDWEFTAEFQEAGNPCSRTQTVALEALSDTTYRLAPHGPANTYDVDIFGRGDGGDVITTVRWTTPADGPLPKPDAYIGIISENDGEIDSYGVEMSVTNLAETPESASASIVVEAAGGESTTIKATPGPTGPEECGGWEGSLWWSADESVGDDAAALGDAPFTYTVTLTLDGVDYVATAIWPDDVRPDWEPYVDLTFAPPLPSLSS